MTVKKRLSEDSREKALEQLMDCTASEELWNKLDSYQREYARKIEKHAVIFVDAPAGTGKTTVAVLVGLEMLRQGKVARIQYVRFVDGRSQKLGFLPGEQEDKERNLMLPFYEAMSECGIQPEAVDKLIEMGMVETSTDINLRGRNFKRTYLIIDEAQNAQNISDLQLVLTRLHDHSGKAIIIGHSGQEDGKVQKYTEHQLNAFQIYQYHMTKKQWATIAELKNNYRGVISQWADKVLDSLQELERERNFPYPADV